jgi:predicted permease
MSLLAAIRNLWRSIAPRTASDVDEEFRSTLDAFQEDLIRQGLSEEEARHKAQIDLGRPAVQNETYRDAVGLRFFDELGGDIRYGLRGLLKNPSFSAVAILSLALGIGATTSMFSLIYAVLLHPVPYADWQRLTYPSYLNDDQPGSPEWWFSLNWPQYQQLLEASTIEDVVGSTNVNSEVTGRDLPEDVTLTYITENVDAFLRVPAMLGRNIQRSDAESTGGQPIVLSFDFWMRDYNGDRAVLNRTLEIDHKPYTVVGVMPRDYAWERDLYVPMSLLPTRERLSVLPVMKLKPGVSLAAADAEIGALLHHFAKDAPQQFPTRFRMRLEHIADRILLSVGHTLVELVVAVLLLLVVGCTNCSILLLARGMSRQSEFAVRSALGASRPRIVRQLLVESLVLAVTGSLLGILLAFWMAKLIFGLFPDVFMHESVIRINLPVLAFSVVLAVISGLLFGLLPSLGMARPDIAQMMQTLGRKVAGGKGQARSLNLLIAAQIALTVVLMGAAGVAISGFLKMTHRDFGYDPAHLMSVPLPFHRHSLFTREQRVEYIETLRRKIATVPGVTQIAISADATPPDSGESRPFEILGAPFTQKQFMRAEFTDAAYFAALRIPLLEGRLWDATENARGAAVCIINQTLARAYFPHGNAVGSRIRLPDLEIPAVNPGELVGVPDTTGWLQVIGVVADSLDNGLDKPVLPAVYVPYARFMWEFTQFLIRTDGPPLAALHPIQLAIQSINSDQQTERNVRDLEQWIAQEPEVQQQRLFSILFGLFSSLALALALVGLYSVVSYSVAQRTNEFGIRMALGAQRAHVLSIVSRSIGLTVVCGLAAGLVLFVALHSLLIHIAGSSGSNPFILVGVVALFLFSAALACTIPAMRATSIDPMQAIRYE